MLAFITHITSYCQCLLYAWQWWSWERGRPQPWASSLSSLYPSLTNPCPQAAHFRTGHQKARCVRMIFWEESECEEQEESSLMNRGVREQERAKGLPSHKHYHWSRSFPLFSPDPVPNYGILSFQTRPRAVAHPPQNLQAELTKEGSGSRWPELESPSSAAYWLCDLGQVVMSLCLNFLLICEFGL